jgi:hypothetical protein
MLRPRLVRHGAKPAGCTYRFQRALPCGVRTPSVLWCTYTGQVIQPVMAAAERLRRRQRRLATTSAPPRWWNTAAALDPIPPQRGQDHDQP